MLILAFILKIKCIINDFCSTTRRLYSKNIKAQYGRRACSRLSLA